MLVLSRALLETLRAQAAVAVPAECCGLLLGKEAGGVRRIDGVAAGPNGTPTRYGIAPAAFLAAELSARARGAFVCGVYHSHPRGSATPSVIDRALAWPGFDYLILPEGGRAPRAWRLRGDRTGFVETPLELAG